MSTIFFHHALLPDGFAANVRIRVAGGLISEVTPDATPAPDEPRHGIALPGMPNLHSHAFQRAFAGLTEQRGEGTDSFWSWRDLMYRFALQMTPDDVEAVATLAFTEMLEGGFTSVAEFHYLHHAPDGQPYDNIAEMAARIAAAAAETGIDLLLLAVFYAHAGFGGTPPNASQRRFINNLDQYEKLWEKCRSLGRTGIAPHSLRAVTPDELAALVSLAGSAPFHIHIAEQTQEVTDCIAWSGAAPIEWLLAHAAVDEHWCLVHATHASVKERAGMAASGAVVGLCPITEANLGDGIFHARNFAGAFGIGSDSNVLIGVAEELRQLEYSQRLLVRQRNVMADAKSRSTATALYQRAVAGGAQALGQPASGLTVGAPANFVTLAPGVDPDIALSRAVFASRARAVDSVWVRGRQLVAQGRHAGAEPARRRFDQVVAKLL
jgi:formiminoglutamate deiminase